MFQTTTQLCFQQGCVVRYRNIVANVLSAIFNINTYGTSRDTREGGKMKLPFYPKSRYKRYKGFNTAQHVAIGAFLFRQYAGQSRRGFVEW